MLKIDMHTHIIPRQLPDWAAKFGYGDFIMLNPNEDGTADMMQGGKFFRRIEPNCWDEKIRIKEYEAGHTLMQVVCTIPVLFAYDTKGKDGLQVSEFLNDHIIDLCNRFPEHYLGLGTLPMQDPQLAIQELERIAKLGMKGIQIGSNINQKNLSEAEFFPVFEACARLNMAVLIHPWQMMGENDMRKYWLPWLVGMPAETTRAACSLIFGGVLERLPHLRVCFAHAGGSLIPTIGRIEHGFNCRPDLVAIDNPINPRDYLGKFWVDSATHDLDLLKYILKYQGSMKVCFGTDYPFPLGDLQLGKFIEESDILLADQENIFSKACLSWLGMERI